MIFAKYETWCINDMQYYNDAHKVLGCFENFRFCFEFKIAMKSDAGPLF